MKKPNEFVEVFMSLIKWFLIVLLINNLIWATVYVISTDNNEKTQTITEMKQDGQGNYQEMNNG